MMRTQRVGLAAAAAVVTVGFWVGLGAQQEMRSRPGPGSGLMDVNVVNHPAVTAAQSGDWRVTLADTATVRVANTPTVVVEGPSFVSPGSVYRVTWENEQIDTVRIVSVERNGWVRIDNGGSGGRSRWINLNNARWVEEAR